VTFQLAEFHFAESGTAFILPNFNSVRDMVKVRDRVGLGLGLGDRDRVRIKIRQIEIRRNEIQRVEIWRVETEPHTDGEQVRNYAIFRPYP